MAEKNSAPAELGYIGAKEIYDLHNLQIVT